LILFPVPGNKNKTNKPFSNEIIESWNNILLSSASKKKNHGSIQGQAAFKILFAKE